MSGISVPSASISVSASASAAGEATATTSVASCLSHLCRRHSHSKVSFSVSQKPKLLRFCSSKATHSGFNHAVSVRAQLNKVSALDGSANSASSPESKSKASAKEVKNDKPTNEYSSSVLASEESISEFIAQVSSLVKLVDSRDIVELEMKQLDCELVIRKKEAIAPTQAPMYMMQPPPQTMMHQAAPPAAATPAAQAPSPANAAPAAAAAAPAKASLPPLKCPMAGTFYRSPGPGEPPFVKIGDKVQKGQVLCIIEAMKLMNEIEADQSGTIVEVVAEDGKPVSIDTPLFVIQP